MGKRIQELALRNLGSEVLQLGYVGENIHTQIEINCAEVFLDYPDAQAVMVVKPPAGDLYHAVLTKDKNKVIWEITNSDVAYAGSGLVQLTFTDNGEVIKSIIGKTAIEQSIETTGEAPAPLEDWMQRAEETASQLALEAADLAAQALDGMTVSATSGNPGAAISTVDGHKHISFTMPIPSVAENKLVFS